MKIDKNILPHWSILIAILLLSGVLAIVMSNKNCFPYSYEVGEVWQHHAIVAQEDAIVEVVVPKTDSLTKIVEQQYAPAFRMDKEILAAKKEQLTSDFNRQLKLAGKDNAFPDVNKSPKIYLQFAEKLLSKIYEQGILPEQEILKNKTEVTIIRTDQSKTVPIDKVYTKKTAFDVVTDSLPSSTLREPEFLLSLLEDKITPNLVFDEAETDKVRSETYRKFLHYNDTIKKGAIIVNTGEKIDAKTYKHLEAYQDFLSKSHSIWHLIKFFLLNVLALTIFYYAVSYIISKFSK